MIQNKNIPVYNKNKNPSHGSYKILLLIIVVIFITGGIFAWQYRSVPEKKVSEEIIEKVPEEVIEEETANWKTYRNEEQRFEFKYPEAWRYDFWFQETD